MCHKIIDWTRRPKPRQEQEQHVGHTALLPPVEQPPESRAQRLRLVAPERGPRRLYTCLRGHLYQGTQGRPISMQVKKNWVFLGFSGISLKFVLNFVMNFFWGFLVFWRASWHTACISMQVKNPLNFSTFWDFRLFGTFLTFLTFLGTFWLY